MTCQDDGVFVHPLEYVDLLDTKSKPTDGLVSVQKPEQTDDPHELSVLLEAAFFEHIDYVYFRRFRNSDGKHLRSSHVAAYVIDNSKQKLSNDQLAKLHHALWLHGSAPLIYVAWPTRVDVLSCARKPDFWSATDGDGKPEYSPAETLHIAAGVSTALSSRLSAFRLATGTFWEDTENQKLAKDESAAHRSLIQAIVDTDNALDGKNKPHRRKLLVLTVLIKYLEDRGVFPSGHFGRYRASARSFLDLLREGTVDDVSKLLKHFENKFNGDVFAFGDDIEKLTETELRKFAKLFEAKTLGNQLHFWKLYDFQFIPVEVISRLYQRFVTGHGAVYTPPFLAALLLDQVMPYDTMTGKERVLDPSCGSGIFLVGAFKRLVNFWRSKNGWKKPTVEAIKKILSKSIFGIEMESAAVDLTAFSLSLAVCDALHPDVIWKELRFDKLRERNLREGDFFDPETTQSLAENQWPKDFDTVIGNPPFESNLTPAAALQDKQRPSSEPKLPDKQIAYLFLEQGLRSLSKNGRLCLIQPHGLIYNSNPVAFFRHLSSLAALHTIFDFVSIRGLYDGADPKTIAWLACNETEAPAHISHLTFRRTYSASEQLQFELDHYDWHEMPRNDANNNRFVWRTNLLGGGRLLEMSDRLLKCTNLKTWVDNQGDGWEYGEGFIAGKSGKRSVAEFLTGLPLIPTKAFSEIGIDRNQLVGSFVEAKLFKSAYSLERYTPPLVLIKAHESVPVEWWNEYPIAYRDKIIGVHAPKGSTQQLRWLFDFIARNRTTLRFCMLINGSQGLTGKSTVPLKQDIDLLPVPTNPSELELSFWEQTLRDDVNDLMADYVRLGQDSKLLKHQAKLKEVGVYSALLVRMLGSIYSNLKAGEPVFLNGLIAQPFFFGNKPEVSWLGKGKEEALQKLVYDSSRESLRLIRVVRFYEENVILIIKPDRLRYWIQSTAIRDADDTLADLRQQGW